MITFQGVTNIAIPGGYIGMGLVAKEHHRGGIHHTAIDFISEPHSAAALPSFKLSLQIRL